MRVISLSSFCCWDPKLRFNRPTKYESSLFQWHSLELSLKAFIISLWVNSLESLFISPSLIFHQTRRNIKFPGTSRSWGLRMRFKRWKILISMMRRNLKSECTAWFKISVFIIVTLFQILEHEKRKLPWNTMRDCSEVTSGQPWKQDKSSGTEERKIHSETFCRLRSSLLSQWPKVRLRFPRRNWPLRIGFTCLQVGMTCISISNFLIAFWILDFLIRHSSTSTCNRDTFESPLRAKYSKWRWTTKFVLTRPLLSAPWRLVICW